MLILGSAIIFGALMFAELTTNVSLAVHIAFITSGILFLSSLIISRSEQVDRLEDSTKQTPQLVKNKTN